MEVEYTSTHVAQQECSEHERLKTAVVEAAKACRAAELAVDDFWTRQPEGEASDARVLGPLAQAVARSREVQQAAVDALIAFEAEHKIGE
jgi:hypothetical protein